MKIVFEFTAKEMKSLLKFSEKWLFDNSGKYISVDANRKRVAYNNLQLSCDFHKAIAGEFKSMKKKSTASERN